MNGLISSTTDVSADPDELISVSRIEHSTPEGVVSFTLYPATVDVNQLTSVLTSGVTQQLLGRVSTNSEKSPDVDTVTTTQGLATTANMDQGKSTSGGSISPHLRSSSTLIGTLKTTQTDEPIFDGHISTRGRSSPGVPTLRTLSRAMLLRETTITQTRTDGYGVYGERLFTSWRRVMSGSSTEFLSTTSAVTRFVAPKGKMLFSV